MAQNDAQTTDGNGSDDAGLRLRALVSELIQRHEFGRSAGLSFPTSRSTVAGWHRDLYFSLGYPTEIPADGYRTRYERGDIAERIVEAYPRATWVSGATIQEDADPENLTEFEEATLGLFDRLDVWARLQRADILSGLGEYSVILIGAEGDLAQPLSALSGPDAVLYLTALTEKRALIAKSVEDTADPRFGLPETYQLDLGKASTRRAHWSRVIHVAEGLLDDDVHGKPRLRSIWNRLMDLEKLVGGGSEAAWKRMDPGMLLNLTREPGVRIDDDEIGKIEDALQEYIHGMRRTLITQGADVELLSAQVAGFGGNVDTVLKLISATTGIPLRILTGSERGELASSQDHTNWSERIAERRREFAEPLVRDLVDRLVTHGALPEPQGYEVVWPSGDESSEPEKAEIAGEIATANKAQAEAGDSVILTSAEIRERVFGLEPLDEDAIPDEEIAAMRAAAVLPIHRVADRRAESLARVFDNAWEAARDAVDLSALEDALVAGNRERAHVLLEDAIKRASERMLGEEALR